MGNNTDELRLFFRQSTGMVLTVTVLLALVWSVAFADPDAGWGFVSHGITTWCIYLAVAAVDARKSSTSPLCIRAFRLCVVVLVCDLSVLALVVVLYSKLHLPVHVVMGVLSAASVSLLASGFVLVGAYARS